MTEPKPGIPPITLCVCSAYPALVRENLATPDLGRRRRRLESGDDSTFIRQLRESGGVVAFLPDAPAIHTVRPEKATVRYVLRRAWWQGRSGVRRDDWRAGLTKEIRRSWQGAWTLAGRSFATSCNIAVVAGIAAELAMRWCTTSRCRAGAEPEVRPRVTCPDDAAATTERARARPTPAPGGLP
jgi:hypothetical protein